jgi:hypothetical protein
MIIDNPGESSIFPTHLNQNKVSSLTTLILGKHEAKSKIDFDESLFQGFLSNCSESKTLRVLFNIFILQD